MITRKHVQLRAAELFCSFRILRDGMIAYDRRHGWRGPVAQIAVGEIGRAHV